MNKEQNFKNSTEARNDGNTVLATVFDFNERVVWDSGFGYEIGHFLREGN